MGREGREGTRWGTLERVSLSPNALSRAEETSKSIVETLSLSLSASPLRGDIPDEQLIELFREMERTSRTYRESFRSC